MADERIEAAALIFDFQEQSDNIEHWRQFVKNNMGAKHEGDCPHIPNPAPFTCSRCVCDEMFVLVERLRAALSASDRTAVPGEGRELRALVEEVVGSHNEYRGREGAERALMLFSRLVESGWFKRANAALAAAEREDRLERVLETLIKPSWLGPETDGNMIANEAKRMAAAIRAALALSPGKVEGPREKIGVGKQETGL